MEPPNHAAAAGRRPFLRRFATLALTLALVVPVLPSSAEATWRCGRRLVTLGDTAAEVLSRCGPPSFRLASSELVSFRTSRHVELTRVIPVERWTYDRGPHEFVRELTFRDGYLDDIDEGGYGYGD